MSNKDKETIKEDASGASPKEEPKKKADNKGNKSEPLEKSTKTGKQDTAKKNSKKAPSESAADKLAELSTVNAKLAAENRALQEQMLLKKADFENYRKRVIRDKTDAIQFANRSIISDLLEVLDNFDRAISSSQKSKDFAGLIDGIKMVENQMRSMLTDKWGLKPIESEGSEYDPNLHEALMMEDSEEHKVSMVLEDFQKGYMLHEKVLRPARVKVAKPISKTE